MRHPENENVTSKVTPVPELHAQKFYKTIQDFLEFEEPSTYIQVQHELLNTFLENEKLSQKEIAQIVFYTTYQTSFLSKLKQHWQNFIEFNNIKIDAV